MNHLEQGFGLVSPPSPRQNISGMKKARTCFSSSIIYSVLSRLVLKFRLFLAECLLPWDTSLRFPRRWVNFRNGLLQPKEARSHPFRPSMFPQLTSPTPRPPP